MKELLLDSFTVPLILIAVVWILAKKFPGFLYTFEPPKRIIENRELLWTVLLFITIIIVGNILPNKVIEVRLSTSFVENLAQNWRQILISLANVALDIFFVWYCFKKFNLSWNEIGLRITNIKKIAVISIISASTVITTYILMILGKIPSYFNDPATLKTWLELATNSFSSVIYAPVIEEIILRGIFFTLFRSRTTVINAWILQAVLFSIAHSFSQPPLLAIGPGLIFGLGVITTGSLIPGLFAHMMYNSTGLLAESFTKK